MADHPLKPATDRRLGRPLPHQLPNQPRAHPSAINLSPIIQLTGISGISSRFQLLSQTEGQVPTCYSPVRQSPPKKGLLLRLACVRPAASVRSEPGSNSQVDVEHTHVSISTAQPAPSNTLKLINLSIKPNTKHDKTMKIHQMRATFKPKTLSKFKALTWRPYVCDITYELKFKRYTSG